jgi:hypothetical protein
MTADSAAPTASTERQPWRPYHALALLPALGMLGGLPFANRVYPLVLGLPFLFAWLAGWVIATSAIMGCILALDSAAARRRRAAHPPAHALASSAR